MMSSFSLRLVQTQSERRWSSDWIFLFPSDHRTSTGLIVILRRSLRLLVFREVELHLSPVLCAEIYSPDDRVKRVMEAVQCRAFTVSVSSLRRSMKFSPPPPGLIVTLLRYPLFGICFRIDDVVVHPSENNLIPTSCAALQEGQLVSSCCGSKGDHGSFP